MYISFVDSQAVETIQKLGFASNASDAEAFAGKLIAANIIEHLDENVYQFIMDLSGVPDLDTPNEEQVQCLSSRGRRLTL